MSDHAMLALITVGGFTLQIAGLVILGVYLSAQLRRTTDIARAVDIAAPVLIAALRRSEALTA